MKNLHILLITLFAFTFTNAQIVDIPDANFKDILLNYDPPIDLNNNLLQNLNIKNGNNLNFIFMTVENNPNLTCIQVDDVDYANNRDCENNIWCKDPWAVYSEECELGLGDNTFVHFTLYPNPTQNILSIESQHQIETVKIYNLQGQLIKEESSSSIDVSNLTTGLYFVQVTVDGKRITKKFIKE